MKKIINKIKKYIKENWLFLIIVTAIIALFNIELPYQVYIPGGTINLSNRINVIDGYSKNGSINSTYVSALKGNIPFILMSYIIPDWDLVKNDTVTIQDEPLNDAIKRDTVLMNESMVTAEVAALNSAKIDYEIINQKLRVIYVYKTSKSSLLIGDQILSVDGESVNSSEQLKNTISNKLVTETVKIKIIRNTKEMILDSSFMELESRVVLGVLLSDEYDVKTKNQITINNGHRESGTSAGFMTALAVYNLITDNNITKNRKIAGTGTIDINGNVGEIGGVKYKLIGAVNAKADIFICPKANYDEAAKIKKERKYKIIIYSVSTLDEAINILSK